MNDSAWAGPVTSTAVRVVPVSTSVSLARTPGAGTVSGVSSSVENESATATGASLTGVDGDVDGGGVGVDAVVGLVGELVAAVEVGVGRVGHRRGAGVRRSVVQSTGPIADSVPSSGPVDDGEGEVVVVGVGGAEGDDDGGVLVGGRRQVGGDRRLVELDRDRGAVVERRRAERRRRRGARVSVAPAKPASLR